MLLARFLISRTFIIFLRWTNKKLEILYAFTLVIMDSSIHRSIILLSYKSMGEERYCLITINLLFSIIILSYYTASFKYHIIVEKSPNTSSRRCSSEKFQWRWHRNHKFKRKLIITKWNLKYCKINDIQLFRLCL